MPSTKRWLLCVDLNAYMYIYMSYIWSKIKYFKCLLCASDSIYFWHRNGCSCASVKVFETDNVSIWCGLEPLTFGFMPNAPRGAGDIRLKEWRDWVNGLGSQPAQICQLVDLCRLAGKDGLGPNAAGFRVPADARLPILHASYPLVPWRHWPPLAFPVGARVQQCRVNVRWEYGWTHGLGTKIKNTISFIVAL